MIFIIPGMSRVSSAIFSVSTFQTLFAFQCAVFSEFLKSMFPYLDKIIRRNIPLHKLRSSFNIQAGEEVRRYENGRDRIGQVILTGNSLGECEERLEEVLAKIQIEFTE